MCESHQNHGRPGSKLADGSAHRHDHSTWSRRDFLSSVGLTAAAGTLAMSGVPMRVFARTGMLQRLAAVDTDRVLVIVQLAGGNDGLNTVIPYRNDLYFNARPTLGITDSLSISDKFGLHPQMQGLANMFGEGHMGVVHSVGYPEADLSHFRSTDIWMTAGDGDNVPDTGWGGRYLDDAFPEYADTPSDFPLAVQLGGGAPLLFQGPGAQMGMSIQSMELFDRLSTSAELFTTAGLPDSRIGSEMAFLRSVANDSYRFAGAIQDASGSGQNAVSYTAPNPLADQLSAVARLIRGGLGSRIYHVSLGGFDTHAGQAGTQATLLRYISEAVSTFMEDLSADGWDDRTLVMSFSEFGRRVDQNGSGGTDHGTAAPLFLFGPSVQGGFHGSEPDLANLVNGNLAYGTDFRSVYGAVLTQWFGLPTTESEAILGGSFPAMDLVAGGLGTNSAADPAFPETVSLSQPYPNPAVGSASFNYGLPRAAAARMEVFDMLGRRVRLLDLGHRPAGLGSFQIDATGLPAGTYLARFSAGEQKATTTLIVAR
ncbi:MAG: hypothetical protein ACI80V_001878 [Rhodothermales bacterium]|jgi:uncharacterized protein (DUF1501 family)